MHICFLGGKSFAGEVKTKQKQARGSMGAALMRRKK
jgi:hypothetical protein